MDQKDILNQQLSEIAKLHKLIMELHDSFTEQLGQTQADLDKTKLELDDTTNELNKTKEDLRDTKTELKNENTALCNELQKAKDDLNSELGKTKDEQRKMDIELLKTKNDLCNTTIELQLTKKELLETKLKLRDKEKEVELFHSRVTDDINLLNSEVEFLKNNKTRSSNSTDNSRSPISTDNENQKEERIVGNQVEPPASDNPNPQPFSFFTTDLGGLLSLDRNGVYELASQQAQAHDIDIEELLSDINKRPREEPDQQLFQLNTIPGNVASNQQNDPEYYWFAAVPKKKHPEFENSPRLKYIPLDGTYHLFNQSINLENPQTLTKDTKICSLCPNSAIVDKNNCLRTSWICPHVFACTKCNHRHPFKQNGDFMVYVSEHGLPGLKSKCSHGGRVRKKTRPEDVAEPIEIEIDGELVQIGESELAYYLAGHCGIGFYKSNGRLCFARDPSITNINHIVATIVIRSPLGCFGISDLREKTAYAALVGQVDIRVSMIGSEGLEVGMFLLVANGIEPSLEHPLGTAVAKKHALPIHKKFLVGVVCYIYSDEEVEKLKNNYGIPDMNEDANQIKWVRAIYSIAKQETLIDLDKEKNNENRVKQLENQLKCMETKEAEKREIKKQALASMTIFEICKTEKISDFLLWIEDKQIDLNQMDENGETIIHFTVSENLMVMTRYLLSMGVNVNAINKNKQTPLYVAASNGNNKMVNLLLEHKADVNNVQDTDNQPLNNAIANGQKDTIHLLIDRKANVDMGNKNLWESIETAIKKGHEETVNSFMNHSSIKPIINNNKEMVIERAVEISYNHIIKTLIEEGFDVNHKNTDQRTVLQTALIKGNEEIVRLLIDKKADIETKDKEDLRLLDIAIRNGQKQILELLIDKKSSIDINDTKLRKSLTIALERKHMDTMEIMINKGNIMNIKDTEKKRLLHRVSVDGNKELVEYLLNQKADVNILSDINSTPLHHASIYGRKEVVLCLLHHKALINHKDTGGMTPLHWASSNGQREVVISLLDQKADISCKDYVCSPDPY